MHVWGCTTLYGTFAIPPFIVVEFPGRLAEFEGGAQVTPVVAYPNGYFHDLTLVVEGGFKHHEVALTFITCSQIGGKTANRLLLQ